jgi:RNA polymerase sigma factor (TIGR02999 family)
VTAAGADDGMDADARVDVTGLLRDWRSGDRAALDRLMPLVHDALHRIAGGHLRDERRDHTLQTTALVNEAYLKLLGSDVPWQDRVHFFAVASQCMRRILVDHARARASAKRGGRLLRVTLSEELDPRDAEPLDFLALDRALAELEAHDARKGRVIELHYFTGLTVEEIAQLLGVSAPTVKQDLRFGRAFLRDAL